MDAPAQLTGRCAPGRRGLQGVSTFNRLTAAIADPHMHVEATINHRAGNLRLVLRGDVGFMHLTFAAMRALRRQGHVVPFIDPRRHGGLGVRPIPASRFAAGFFRFGYRLVLLAKRGCLPLALTG